MLARVARGGWASLWLRWGGVAESTQAKPTKTLCRAGPLPDVDPRDTVSPKPRTYKKVQSSSIHNGPQQEPTQCPLVFEKHFFDCLIFIQWNIT